MSARISPSPPDKISPDYVAVAGTTAQGISTDVVDHDSIVREGPQKRLVFGRDDGSGLSPVGARSLIPVSLPPAALLGVSLPAPGAVPVPISVAEVPADCPAPLPPSQPVNPRPQVVVEFVSTIIDLPVLCHEVNWSAETSLLSLLVPSATRLKLVADQLVTIRCAAAGEKVYWFTGIAIPVKVMEAVLLVFGLEKK